MLWLGARLCWEMALRGETPLSKLPLKSVAEESSSGRAEGCPRTFCVRASACKTLASPQLWCTVLSTVLVNRQHSCCCLHAQVYCPNGLSIGSSLAIAAE